MDGKGQRSSSRVLFLGVVFAMLGGAGTQGATLEDAIRLAVNTNPDVRSLAADRRAVEKELRQARAGYYPLIDLRAAAGPEWTDRDANVSEDVGWGAPSLS